LLWIEESADEQRPPSSPHGKTQEIITSGTGLGSCSGPDVAGVRRFQDLVAWQLCVEQCDVICDITETGRSTRDPEFRNQIRNASKKAPALIAEGFLRFTPAEFVRYLRMARAEIGEVQNHLEFGRRRHYFTPEQLDRATAISRRAMAATSGLLKSKLRVST